MNSQAYKKFKLPNSPGVYFFKLGKKILYVGKATSLKDRVKSYFSKDLMRMRGPLVVKMVEEARSISFVQTDSVLEALILEASEIKKHQPDYNTLEKDNTSFNYVVMTKEKFPRVLVVRGRNLGVEETEYKEVYGPFPHGAELKEALRIIRKIFPYRDKCIPQCGRPCFNAQLGLCPGVCSGICGEKEYARILRHLKLFFEGKKKQLIKLLEQEMKLLSKEKKFEQAGEVKKTIFALTHIQDVALMKRGKSSARIRIEAYDIAHLSGQNTVGMMTVIEDGEKKVQDYRKFKIRGVDGKVGVDDTANLSEILLRRFNHPEWPMPNLIVIDGGAGQINSAKRVLKDKGVEVEVVSVVKDERHKPAGFLGSKQLINEHKHEIILANAEAHRFAIQYHRKLRGKAFKF
jgi:excinuclease ABC subunit C